MAPVSSTSASTSVSLKEYLKRYQNPSEDHENKESKKTKKKKKKEAKVIDVRVRVVDEDPIWQKPQNLEEEDEVHESSDEDKPQIDEDVEVKRMKRLEEIRSRRPYLTISDDGSGWVSISENPKLLDSENGVSDMSPSRKRRARFDTPSPEHDESRPSSSKIPKSNPNSADTLTPDRDLSPPRLSHSEVESFDLKMKNSGRHDSPDLSPPPPRRSRSDHERRNLERPKSPDLSPPRHDRPLRGSSDLERKNSERAFSPDLSPPRRNRSSTVKFDLERKNSVRGDSLDLSPPRRSRPQVASSDFRRKNLERNNLPDLSPPQLGRRGSPEFDASRATSGRDDLSPPRKNRKDSSSMKAGRKAGLITTDEIKEEINKKKKEELLRIAEMDPSISGRGSENVYRHQGKRISKDEFLKSQRGEEKPKEKKLEWGKGLAQKREAEARELELEMEKDKPFVRTRYLFIYLRLFQNGRNCDISERDWHDCEERVLEVVLLIEEVFLLEFGIPMFCTYINYTLWTDILSQSALKNEISNQNHCLFPCVDEEVFLLEFGIPMFCTYINYTLWTEILSQSALKNEISNQNHCLFPCVDICNKPCAFLSELLENCVWNLKTSVLPKENGTTWRDVPEVDKMLKGED